MRATPMAPTQTNGTTTATAIGTLAEPAELEGAVGVAGVEIAGKVPGVIETVTDTMKNLKRNSK